MDKYIGRKIDGRYQIQELIGIGGMANVYKGIDTVENRVVAVKILREEYQENEEFLRRFRNESKAIAVLSHPNIVRVYDVSLSDRTPSIVMEYIDGITLKEYIEQEGQVRWKEVLHFTVQILRGLQHAHDNGVVHRDVKPQNIMLLRDGTIKITDFGIARFSRATSKTLTNHAIGSVHYISPEQARGELVDQKSDIYSVGVMMFEMLTGKLPFDGENPVAVAVKQIESRPPRLRDINPNVPEGLEEITIRAMLKDPAKRYQAAAEMLRDIDLFRADPDVSFEYKYMGEAVPSIARKRKEKQQRESGKRKGRLPIIPVLTGITIAFVLATIGFVSLMLYINDPFSRPEDIDLPNLVGLDYETVLKTEKYANNFDIELESMEYNEGYGNGVIFDQNPKPGKKVKAGSVIKVKVSSGTQIVTMPNFAGQEATLVFAELTKLGLKYTESAITSESIQEGYVVRTDPEGGDVPSGTTVTVYVSRGSNKKKTEVPDVTDYHIDDARERLKEHNLKVNIIYAESDESSGTVLKQDPEAGTEVSEDSYVNLTVSMGDARVGKVKILIPLPQSIKSEVNMEVVQNGITVQEQRLTPYIDRVWRPTLTGQGTSTVTILINGEVYQEYAVDFDEGTSNKISDNSGNFVFEE